MLFLVAELSRCILALVALLYPFNWEHTLIPILPAHLLEICATPFPYIIGVQVLDGMVRHGSGRQAFELIFLWNYTILQNLVLLSSVRNLPWKRWSRLNSMTC